MAYRAANIATGKIPNREGLYLSRKDGGSAIILAELRVSEHKFWEHLMTGLGLPFRFEGESCDAGPDSRR